MFSKLKINFVPGLLNTGFNSFFTSSVTANVNRDRLAKVAILIPFLSSSLMIDFIDSSGIGCIISLVKTAKSNDSGIKICNLSREVASVFELLHLQMILEIGKDVESCMASFKEEN